MQNCPGFVAESSENNMDDEDVARPSHKGSIRPALSTKNDMCAFMMDEIISQGGMKGFASYSRANHVSMGNESNE